MKEGIVFLGIIALAIVGILSAMYLFNADEWAAQTERRNTCVASGGVYVIAPSIEGCMMMQPNLQVEQGVE